MQQVGRLREQAFREAGGGTGKSEDIDYHDTSPNGYHQLIAWDVSGCRIVGGYRYIRCDADSVGHISTLDYFAASAVFRANYMPYAVELGRSFVVRCGASSLFAMEALWRGLVRVVSGLEDVRYLFGKVTVYPHFEAEAYRLLRLFLKRFHPSDAPLLKALEPHLIKDGEDPFSGDDYDENYALLLSLLKLRGERLPPMIHAYMRLCRSMQCFDTVRNREFGNTLETAILLRLDDIATAQRERYF